MVSEGSSGLSPQSMMVRAGLSGSCTLPSSEYCGWLSISSTRYVPSSWAVRSTPPNSMPPFMEMYLPRSILSVMIVSFLKSMVSPFCRLSISDAL